MVAFKAGVCADCDRAIRIGDTFEWGRTRGQRVHVDCEGSLAAERMVEVDFTPAPAPSARRWSKYQEAIFEFIVNGSGSGMVRGVAGCAKTTTIEEGARRLPPNVQAKYLVFNTKNADEAKQRMPSNVDAGTFHSVCNYAVRKRLGRVEVDRRKVWKLLDSFLDEFKITEQEHELNGSEIVRLVGLAKNAGIGCLASDTPAEWRAIVEHHAIEFESPDGENGDREDDDYTENREAVVTRCLDIAADLLRASNEKMDSIDFDDMLYLTAKLGLALPQFDVVFVDEAQDTNAIQRDILRKIVRHGGRLIAVGDPRQAIYGFRGADADAMDQIARDFSCIHLPLSINYRCSKAVIERAKTYCPEIEAWDGAPEGSVEVLDAWTMEQFEATDAILCRNTAPLIEAAYAMLAKGVPCTVLGRDIGARLISLVKLMQGDRKQNITIDRLLDRLHEYQTNETKRMLAKGQEDRVQSLLDKIESLRVIINGLPETQRTLRGLTDAIERLFSDKAGDRLTLATVHKAKGLEWKRVFILDPYRMPSKFARRPWQVEQERNLVYVAYTRAKVDLLFLDANKLVTAKGD